MTVTSSITLDSSESVVISTLREKARRGARDTDKAHQKRPAVYPSQRLPWSEGIRPNLSRFSRYPSHVSVPTRPTIRPWSEGIRPLFVLYSSLYPSLVPPL